MNIDAVKESLAVADDGSVTPIEAITALLVASGHPNPGHWLNELDQRAFHTSDEAMQRFLINRYWRMQIMTLSEDTIDIRYCLVDEPHIKTADWLRIFQKGVLPCILKHQLPSSMSKFATTQPA